MGPTPIPSEGCLRARQLFSSHLDSELSELEEAFLEAHLAECPECRALGVELESLTAALRAAPLETPTASFRLPSRPGIPVHALRAVSAAAAVAVIAVSGLVGLHFAPSRAPGVDTSDNRARLALKERLLRRLDTGTPAQARQRSKVGVSAGEAILLLRQEGPAAGKIPPEDAFGTSEGR